MNTLEINRFLRNRVRDFDGVFSINTLPEEPYLLVCNTDPSHLPGEHWIAIYIGEDGHGEFFDSFGRYPDNYLESYMNRHCTSWHYNDRQLQSVISKYCGHYCIYFCIKRSLGVNMRKIVHSFTTDTGLNDALVRAYVKKH